MVSKKNTKKALLMSALSLLLCCSMLIGTTFAWFTDEVTSGKNQIIAGNLDVELEYARVVDGQITGWDTVAGKTAIFDPNALWEPGRVEVVYLKVSNLGTLELKYQLGVNVYKEITGKTEDGKDINLSEHLVFKVVEMPDALTTYTDREAVQLAAGTEKGLKDYNGETKALDPKDGANDEDYVALIVYMPETVGNEANYRGTAIPTIELGINLFATQKDAESDSFGPDYDEDAWHADMIVFNAAELAAALHNGGKIELGADVTLTESVEIPEGIEATLNLNGKTVTGTAVKQVHTLVNNGVLEVFDGTITSAGNDGGSAIRNNGTMVVTNAVLNGAPYAGADGIWFPSYAVNNYGEMTINSCTIVANHGGVANSKNAKVELNDVTIEVKGFGGSSHVFYNSGELTINSGSYTHKGKGDGTILSNSNIAVVNGGTFVVEGGAYGPALSKGTLTINGGDLSDITAFYNWGGTASVAGGTFGFNPAAYIVAGYKAVLADGSYYVVADNVAGVVTKPETLKDALSAAGAAGAGNTTIAFFGNIDMSGTAWTPIKVDGYHGADIVTIEGNGATITGLTAPLFAGGFAGGSGIVIKDLTIADSNIVSTNTIGSGAFIESVDSMALITLDNCHLVNSTVTGGDGSRTGGLIGWTAGYNNVNDGPVKTYVTITDCSVVGCEISCNGSVGGIYGHAGNNAWTYSTIENCTVKNNKLNSTDDGGWRVGVVVGTANVGEVTISNITESGNTLTQTGKTAPAGQSNLYGRFVPVTTGKLVIDGAYVLPAATQEALNNAISAGETEIALPAGTYVVPSAVSGKTVSIVGNGDTVIDITTVPTYAGLPGATITFENVIIKSDQQGAGYDRGFAHTNKITYNNCVINGTLGLNTDTEFNGCTFNISGDYYNLWTWGAENVTLNGCTFNSDGKALLLYGTANTKLTVNNCTFNDNGGLTDLKAAIEIGNDYHKSYELIVNNTVVNGYEINDKGIITGTTLWANKNSMGTDKLNVVVDGVDVY